MDNLNHAPLARYNPWNKATCELEYYCEYYRRSTSSFCFKKSFSECQSALILSRKSDVILNYIISDKTTVKYGHKDISHSYNSITCDCL